MNLLFTYQPDDTTHHSILKEGLAAKTKSFLKKLIKLQDLGQHKHHTEFWLFYSWLSFPALEIKESFLILTEAKSFSYITNPL